MYKGEKQHCDSVLALAVCRAQGIGMTKNENDLMKLAEGLFYSPRSLFTFRIFHESFL